ncbi:MAG: GatB/YqeY domain-containing protein [Patescibacteria group bacterium]|nr:GatB/YqeY domain-containing protein [Patescibacteria group bacterium]MDE2015380.1 GatB/YqeY domain-containing protein [Patescibacteria group bacterium]MDE2227005.1 GatB/YqeY domain-containing protein [Patescibacteria group bacterium]
MSLVDRIKEDVKASLKSGASARAGVLRLLLAELLNKEKEKFGGTGGNLEDADAIAVLQKEAKKRKDAIELFRKGQREDLEEKDEAELKIVGEYLPQPMSVGEIGSIIDGVIAKGASDFNSIMKEAMKELKGRVDGRVVGNIIKEKIK